jgi:hypothetical protein
MQVTDVPHRIDFDIEEQLELGGREAHRRAQTATVRTRRWCMDQLEREVTMQTAPLKLYLSEDFQEAARAFAEKRKPGPFKGR